MNEFSAKKIGEVLAFDEVAFETFERARLAFEEVFGAADVQALISGVRVRIESLRKFASDFELEDIIFPKAEATAGKLRHMRDFYVGDEWDNAVELMEWSGFFHGAGIVHWNLVAGVEESLDLEVLGELVENGRSFHEDALRVINAKIKVVGQERA